MKFHKDFNDIFGKVKNKKITNNPINSQEVQKQSENALKWTSMVFKKNDKSLCVKVRDIKPNLSMLYLYDEEDMIRNTVLDHNSKIFAKFYDEIMKLEQS